MDVNILCRICLETSDGHANLFSSDSKSKLLLEKINLCFRLKIDEEPNLPRQICSKCVDDLNTAYTFRHKCLTFEARYSVLINEKLEEQITKSDICEDSSNLEQLNFSEVLINNITGKNNYTKHNMYQCDMCNKVLKTKLSLKKHIISMHEKRRRALTVTGTGVNRRYHCSKCPYSTPHSQTLVNHMRRHNGERPYQCQCGKSFAQSSTFVTHQKIHIEDKSFTCSTCGKQFKHAHSLKCHGKVHEPGTLSCNICNKVLKSHKSLQEHMQRHFNIRNFNCEECGATFVSCSDLINHRKKHDAKTKALDCHLCDYKTNAKGNLVLHLKRHAGNKVFKCNLCNVAVYTRSELQRHRRVHTHEKPFPCHMCGQRFSHSPSLNKHMANVHGIQFKWQEIKNNTKSVPNNNT